MKYFSVSKNNVLIINRLKITSLLIGLLKTSL